MDENSTFFHGMLKNKRRQLLVRWVSVGGEWVSDPISVKTDFLIIILLNSNTFITFRCLIEVVGFLLSWLMRFRF